MCVAVALPVRKETMRSTVSTIVLAAVLPVVLAAPADAGYAVARGMTPVLNTPAIASIFGGRNHSRLKTDACGQVRELEFIALPGTPFRIIASRTVDGATVHQVESGDYPAPPGVRLYLDDRFVERRDTPPSLRLRALPAREQLVSRLRDALGAPYVWGGNALQGVPELLDYFYRPGMGAGEGRLTLAGLDCSGLLYHASDGWTPRNTSQLVGFGRAVPVAGKRPEEIALLLEPLDLIVWKGHVIIVLDRATAIESRLECDRPGSGGVLATPLLTRLREVASSRRPVDIWPAAGNGKGIFVVRRWYP